MDWILLLTSMGIAIAADLYVRGTYKSMSKVKNAKNVTGQEVAQKILKDNQVNVYVVETQGVMSDHYDGARKVVRLSPKVFNDTSIASIAIAAHEAAHAIQDKEGYGPLKIRSMIAPIAGFASSVSYIAIIIGIFASSLDFLYVGIGLLLLVLLFQLVTLPVEFNASAKAKSELEKLNLVNVKEKGLVDKMLKAAAFTYVASVITAILEIVRLVLISRD